MNGCFEPAHGSEITGQNRILSIYGESLRGVFGRDSRVGSAGLGYGTAGTTTGPTMDQNPQLKVLEGELQGARFEVTEHGIVIGRGEDCAVRLPEPGVSREHARVFLHNAGVWVQDLGSRNGVFVKDTRITRAKQLSPGTRFKVGGHVFVLELSDDAPEKSSTPPVVQIAEGTTESANEPTVSIPVPKRPGAGFGIWTWVVVGFVAAAIAALLFAG